MRVIGYSRRKPPLSQSLGQTPYNPVSGKHWPMGYPDMFKVLFIKKQIDGDYLLCDDGNNGEEFKVGLPMNMRKTFYERHEEPQFVDGKYYVWGAIAKTQNDDKKDVSWQQERTVSDTGPDLMDEDSVIDKQYITPPYALGDPILVINLPDYKDANDVKWMDMNTAGRTWAVSLETEPFSLTLENMTAKCCNLYHLGAQIQFYQEGSIEVELPEKIDAYVGMEYNYASRKVELIAGGHLSEVSEGSRFGIPDEVYKRALYILKSEIVDSERIWSIVLDLRNQPVHVIRT